MRVIFLILMVAWMAGCASRSPLVQVPVPVQEEQVQRAPEPDPLRFVPQEFRRPLPYRADRYEAVGFSSPMLLEETARHRAKADMLNNLAISVKVAVNNHMQNYLGSHPVLTEVGKIDPELSMSEIFYENVSEQLTGVLLKGVVIASYWKDKDGVLADQGTYCYGFVPKRIEAIEKVGLGLAEQELATLRGQAMKRYLSEKTATRVDVLLGELRNQLKDNPDFARAVPEQGE